MGNNYTLLIECSFHFVRVDFLIRPLKLQQWHSTVLGVRLYSFSKNAVLSGIRAGVCLGMQLAVCEFARNVLGWEGERLRTRRHLIPSSIWPSRLGRQFEPLSLSFLRRQLHRVQPGLQVPCGRLSSCVQWIMFTPTTEKKYAGMRCTNMNNCESRWAWGNGDSWWEKKLAVGRHAIRKPGCKLFLMNYSNDSMNTYSTKVT